MTKSKIKVYMYVGCPEYILSCKISTCRFIDLILHIYNGFVSCCDLFVTDLLSNALSIYELNAYIWLQPGRTKTSASIYKLLLQCLDH